MGEEASKHLKALAKRCRSERRLSFSLSQSSTGPPSTLPLIFSSYLWRETTGHAGKQLSS